MNIKSTPRYYLQNGLTIVELMIALAIGLFMIGAVSTLYVRMRSSFDYLTEVTRMQESGRFAMETIARDVRMAGYNGCGKSVKSLVNVVNGAGSNPFLDFSTPIRGYEGGVDTLPSALTTAGALSGTDAIILLGVDTSNELVVQNHNPNSAQIDTNTHSIKPGEILLITDCSKASIFQMTGPTNNNNNASNVVHNTGTGTPGNCYKALGASCGAGAVNYTYKPGSSLLRIYSNAYFIGNSSLGDGSRSLFTMALEGSTTGSSATKELITGIENMQVTYGLDANGDGTAEKFVTADAVGSSNWSQVTTVRISLLIRSTKTNIATGNQTYTYSTTAGSTTEISVTPNDKILRQVLSETIVARNRTL